VDDELKAPDLAGLRQRGSQPLHQRRLAQRGRRRLAGG
jgi:hypothetical protein